MGKWGSFFFSKTVAHLESLKATLKDQAEIEEIDKAIETLKAQEK